MQNRAAVSLLIPLAFLAGTATAATTVSEQSAVEREAAGVEHGIVVPPQASPKLLAPIVGEVLLITNVSVDKVSAFDPFDGAYLGDVIDGTGVWTTPINVVQGPDGNLYVSDQVKDSVFVYDVAGNFLFTYADATDGLDNIRGIDFHNGHLFVTSGDDYVAEFAGPHMRLPDFIPSGADPFDIHFLPDGRALLTNISGNDVRLYKADGTLDSVLFSLSFPEQVTDDPLAPGEFLTGAFTSDVIHDFSLDGTIHQSTPLPTSARGVFRLGNGNILSAGQPGLQVLTPGTGAVVSTIDPGTGWRFIERATLGAWANLGQALPGVLGAPVLSGEGALQGGNTITLTLTNAAPNTTAFLIVGAQNLSAPFFGGILVPFPTIIVGLPTGATGTVVLSTSYPSGVPAGFPVYVQYWIADPSGPQGFTASNALTATTE